MDKVIHVVFLKDSWSSEPVAMKAFESEEKADFYAEGIKSSNPNVNVWVEHINFEEE